MNQTTTTVKIRECAVNDIPMLVALGERTFRETFDEVNTKENMQHYVSATFNHQAFEKDFQGKAKFFVAEVDGEVAGFCKLNPGNFWEDVPRDHIEKLKPLEIERIYALKKMIGKGVGKALMEHCLTHATRNGYNIIWLGVWEHNHAAIAFYKKWGFEFFGQHVFRLGDDAQTDLLMKKSLT